MARALIVLGERQSHASRCHYATGGSQGDELAPVHPRRPRPSRFVTSLVSGGGRPTRGARIVGRDTTLKFGVGVHRSIVPGLEPCLRVTSGFQLLHRG